MSILIAGIYSVYNFTTSEGGRAKGLTDTMRYGYGSAMMLLTLLSAILHREHLKSWFNWRLAIPVFLVGFLGMYFTYTRGALLGFLCGLPFVFYYYRPKFGVLFLGGMYLFGSG